MAASLISGTIYSLFALLPLKQHIDHLPIKFDHAIYISVVEIEHESDGAALISIKVFSDDISDAIFNHSQNRLKFEPNAACSGHKNEITQYFDEHLKISINDKDVELLLRNCEINGESVWFNFKADSPNKWNELTIKDDHLMELFPTQTNIFNVTDGEHKKMFKLTTGNKTLTFSFTD